MCGIAGIVGRPERKVLQEVIHAIQHRGPDNEGIFLQEEVGLAQARLAIIDLSKGGNQPMLDVQKKVVITFNGEIYNYKALRKELIGKYQFNSNSDTEVLLNLYLEYGIDMLQKINGMFAFALYDFAKKELFIAKDRMGKKPFYYTEVNQSFVFASELKAILKHPDVSKDLNLEALNEYLTFDYVPTPKTLINKVYKLEAAHYLIVKNGKIVKKEAYWKPQFKVNNSLSFTDAKKQFDHLLNTAVADRMMSDVPLGIFLSGGLDSSTVAYYAQKNSTQRVKTFSIGFEDKSYDESDYAQKVARHIGSEHYSEVLKPKQTIDLIQEIYPKVDEPFADASLIPTYFLSKMTRKDVTVALGGDGSDELLAGYPTFISNYFKRPFSTTKILSSTLYKGTRMFLPVSDNNISFDFKVSQFLRGFSSKKDHIHQLWLGSFLPKEKKQLLSNSYYNQLVDKDGLSLIDKVFQTSPAQQDLNKMIHYYCKTYLHDDILVKVDRASMLCSLEVRAPFLDTRVIEFVNSLPKTYKLKGFSGKYLLKKTMEGKIPSDIIFRPKKGFGIPLSKWLRTELKDLCDDLFSKANIEKVGIFNYDYIKQLREEHDNFKQNHRKLIWNLLMFLLWHRHYMQ